jgi:uncharacterized membrane protein YgdD (TMEM256/DUF423 family)
LSPLDRILAVIAALMGAAGVALAAAAQHAAGGELPHTASLFLVLHAAALIGVSAQRAGRFASIAGLVLAAGAVLFAADLSSRAFLGARLFPFAAPLGGTTMILSWLALALALGLRRGDRPAA